MIVEFPDICVCSDMLGFPIPVFPMIQNIRLSVAAFVTKGSGFLSSILVVFSTIVRTNICGGEYAILKFCAAMFSNK